MPSPICLRLLVQLVRRAFSRAFAKTGNNIAASIAMIAITTSSSISVKARWRRDGQHCRDENDNGSMMFIWFLPGANKDNDSGYALSRRTRLQGRAKVV